MVGTRVSLTSALADVCLFVADPGDALVSVNTLAPVVEHLLLTLFVHAGGFN